MEKPWGMQTLASALTHTHTHPFNGPLSGTTRVSRYQKGKTNLNFTEARDSEWQWHQLGHMQVCTSIQTDNHASTPPLSFYRPDAIPAAQPTVSKHWRQHLPQVNNLQTSSYSKSLKLFCVSVKRNHVRYYALHEASEGTIILYAP